MDGDESFVSEETATTTSDEDTFLNAQAAWNKGGFGSDKIRQRAWRLLCELNVPDGHVSDEALSRPSLQDIANHPEFHQVQGDARRTLLRFPPNTTESERQKLLEALTPLVIKLLIAYPEAKYYQGFHDICLTVLLALGPKDALFVCYCLAKMFFYRFLEKPMECTRKDLNRIYMIVANEDWDLYCHLVSHEVPDIFALSWIITWFSHDLEHYDSVTRLFDFFMTSDEDMPLYVAAAMLLSSREDVINLSDSADIFKTLLCLPRSVELECSIEKAVELHGKYPPETLAFPKRQGLLRVIFTGAKMVWVLWFAFGILTAAATLYVITWFEHK